LDENQHSLARARLRHPPCAAEVDPSRRLTRRRSYRRATRASFTRQRSSGWPARLWCLLRLVSTSRSANRRLRMAPQPCFAKRQCAKRKAALLLPPKRRRPDRGLRRPAMADTHRRPATVTRFCSVAGSADSIVFPLQQLVDPEQKRFALGASASTQLVVRESSIELMIERSLPSSRAAHAAQGAACLETGRAGWSPTGEALPRATTS